jgi:hypothetical protein
MSCIYMLNSFLSLALNCHEIRRKEITEIFQFLDNSSYSVVCKVWCQDLSLFKGRERSKSFMYSNRT